MRPNRKILLINTSVTTIKQYSHVFGYPVGLMAIAGYIRAQGFAAVTILDFNVPGAFEGLEETIRREQPAVVGMCGLTTDQECIEYTGRKIKQWLPDCLLICGGPYASASPQRVAGYPFIDLAVIGEGELTFTEILQRYLDGRELIGIKGTAYTTADGSVRQEPAREAIMDLDSLPLPAFDLVDIEFYSTHLSMATVGIRPYMSLFSSRACPYQCTYCHAIFGKTFRAQSPERMVEIIEHLIEHYGIRDYEFYDDIWNLDRDRVRRFCELVIAKRLDIAYHFPNGLRTDRLTEELLVLMKQSGCRYFCVAVESADKAMQKQIKKFNKLDKIRDMINLADRLGIMTNGFFMIGFPGETYAQMLKTCWFVISSRLHIADLFAVTPFEGTELYADLEKADKLNKNNLQKFDAGAYHNRVSDMSAVPKWLIFITLRLTFILTYANPVRIYRVFRLYPYPGSLRRKIYQLILRMLGMKKMPREHIFEELRVREEASGRQTGGGPVASLVRVGTP
ncbi:MAG: B12-binding domain-containing radical SAM protein [Candidatus Omnitrophica bacterium]|nr:B12-binding domain-containing radical SAM protein [Candidatus Omnitrophota bacterium]